MNVLDRREIAERVVGSFLGVFQHPPVDGLADVVEAGKEMLVQQFVAQRAVEALDVGVLAGPAWRW